MHPTNRNERKVRDKPCAEWRFAMHTSISCKELGIDCNFVIEGETEGNAVELLIRHVKEEHTDDWYEIEEIYQAAGSVVRTKAA